MLFKDYEEFVTKLKGLGFSTAYYQFRVDENPKLPYLVHFITNNNDLAADNINYKSTYDIQVELYQRDRNFSSQKKLEDLLKEFKIFYRHTETYIAETDMFLLIYQFNLKFKEENNE